MHNDTDTKRTVRKGTKIQSVEHLIDNESIYPKRNKMFQIKNINLTEIHKLRK